MGGKSVDEQAAELDQKVPQVPPVDPRLAAARDQQLQAAQDFQNNLPGYKQKQYDVSKEQGAEKLQGQQRQVAQGASSRGLLYGGLQQGAQAQAQAQNASEQAGQRANINAAAESQATDLRDKALNTGFGVESLEVQRNAANIQRKANVYNMAIGMQKKGLLG